MRHPLAIVVGALLTLGTSLTWGAPRPGAELDAELQALRVARGLDLRQDQIDALPPLLQQAQEALTAEKTKLAETWKTYKDGIAAVNVAWEKGAEPDAAAKEQADEALKAYQATIAATRLALQGLVTSMVGLLDDGQAEQIQTAQDRAADSEDRERFGGDATLAEYMARQIMVLRQLPPGEYGTVRSPIAVHLALFVLPLDNPAFLDVARQVLDLEDTVRNMTDAQFARDRAGLAPEIAQRFRLPAPAAPDSQPLTVDDLLAFVTNPKTAEYLKAYKPAPPQPGPGGGQQ